MDNNKSMGDIFKELRLKKEFTQRGLALKMGISNSTISKIENDERRPKYELLKKFSEALDVDLGYLLSISKEAPLYIKRGYPTVKMPPLKVKEKEIEYVPREIDMSLKVPLVGIIRAGEPIISEQNIEGYITLDRNSLCPDKTYYALKVQGDSMDKLFPESTTLVIEKTEMVENNQIAVVGVNGYEATVKKVTFADDNIALIPQSNNPAYETKVYNIQKDEIHIMGRVIQAIRFF